MRENISSIVIQGNKVRTNNNNSDVFANQWGEFLKQHTVEEDIFAVYTNYDSDYTGNFDFIIGTENSTEKSSVTIPQGKYFVWKVEKNDPHSVGMAWKEIWHSDVPRTYQTDFEWYKTDGTISIYLSVSSQD
ncbi:GyrI-like domain-containing protein [Psychrobacillus sp. FJAT-21963]|uniref:GyrI-like domain-containing protein n=1 Tax=Psychrobacillus sp. FJAT-21963 TaxID=1712028 RepID=UPI0006F93487|nr:GyrI-like domain-containing protein [Psychrobacillus sp. FJAT-21963]